MGLAVETRVGYRVSGFGDPVIERGCGTGWDRRMKGGFASMVARRGQDLGMVSGNFGVGRKDLE